MSNRVTFFLLFILNVAYCGFLNGELESENSLHCRTSIRKVLKNCCFDYEVNLLIFNPCVDDLDYAVKVGRNFEGELVYKYRDICPDWEPGFRIKLINPHQCSGYGFSSSLTYFYGNEHTSTFANLETNIVSTLLHPSIDVNGSVTWDRANGDFSLRYYNWDVLCQYPLYHTNCHVLAPFVGIDGVVFDQEIRSRLKRGIQENAVKAKVRWESEFSGVGFKVGSDWTYHFVNCVDFFASFSTSVVIGQFDDRMRHQLRDLSTPENNRSWKFTSRESCNLLSGYHLKLGVLQAVRCYCLELTFSLAYEFMKWYNVSSPSHFFTDTASPGLQGRRAPLYTSTLGLHGISSGLTVHF